MFTKSIRTGEFIVRYSVCDFIKLVILPLRQAGWQRPNRGYPMFRRDAGISRDAGDAGDKKKRRTQPKMNAEKNEFLFVSSALSALLTFNCLYFLQTFGKLPPEVSQCYGLAPKVPITKIRNPQSAIRNPQSAIGLRAKPAPSTLR
jgi:hypothetical protein